MSENQDSYIDYRRRIYNFTKRIDEEIIQRSYDASKTANAVLEYMSKLYKTLQILQTDTNNSYEKICYVKSNDPEIIALGKAKNNANVLFDVLFKYIYYSCEAIYTNRDVAFDVLGSLKFQQDLENDINEIVQECFSETNDRADHEDEGEEIDQIKRFSTLNYKLLDVLFARIKVIAEKCKILSIEKENSSEEYKMSSAEKENPYQKQLHETMDKCLEYADKINASERKLIIDYLNRRNEQIKILQQERIDLISLSRNVHNLNGADNCIIETLCDIYYGPVRLDETKWISAFDDRLDRKINTIFNERLDKSILAEMSTPEQVEKARVIIPMTQSVNHNISLDKVQEAAPALQNILLPGEVLGAENPHQSEVSRMQMNSVGSREHLDELHPNRRLMRSRKISVSHYNTGILFPSSPVPNQTATKNNDVRSFQVEKNASETSIASDSLSSSF